MSSSTMQALVLHAVGDQRHEAVARPEPGPDAALVRVASCGVCGSDIPRTFTKGAYSFPTICGHEFAGTVEAVGEGVTRVAPGDRVAVFPLLWCDRCPACERGQYAQCHDYDYLGSRSDGAFAEYVCAPERNLLAVPEGVSLEEAALTEPAAVALHAIRRGDTRAGDSVAIFGAGPIGLMLAQWARWMGAGPILLFDIVPEKLEMARGLGFEHAFDSREGDPVARIESMTGGLGAHVTIEGAGVPSTMIQALRACRHGGRVVLMGNPSGDVSLEPGLISQLLRREVSIRGTWNSAYAAHGADDDWHLVLRALGEGVLDLKPLITHRVGLGGAFDALRMMHERSAFFSKVMIEPGA